MQEMIITGPDSIPEMIGPTPRDRGQQYVLLLLAFCLPPLLALPCILWGIYLARSNKSIVFYLLSFILLALFLNYLTPQYDTISTLQMLTLYSDAFRMQDNFSYYRIYWVLADYWEPFSEYTLFTTFICTLSLLLIYFSVKNYKLPVFNCLLLLAAGVGFMPITGWTRYTFACLIIIFWFQRYKSKMFWWLLPLFLYLAFAVHVGAFFFCGTTLAVYAFLRLFGKEKKLFRNFLAGVIIVALVFLVLPYLMDRFSLINADTVDKYLGDDGRTWDKTDMIYIPMKTLFQIILFYYISQELKKGKIKNLLLYSLYIGATALQLLCITKYVMYERTQILATLAGCLVYLDLLDNHPEPEVEYPVKLQKIIWIYFAGMVILQLKTGVFSIARAAGYESLCFTINARLLYMPSFLLFDIAEWGFSNDLINLFHL